jgi:AraC-like DNA-binding protein
MTCLTFTDYDAFTESIREASMTMRLSAFEIPKWTLQSVNVGTLRLQKGFEGGGSIAEGATFSEGWTFYHQMLPVHTNGQIATKDEVFVAPPGGEFCIACQPIHEWITVFIPTSTLFSTPHEIEFASSAKPMLLRPPPRMTKQFISLTHRFLSAAEQHSELLQSPVAAGKFQEELLFAAKSLFAESPLSESRHFARWYRQTRFTTELAMCRPDLSLSISDLAHQSGVAERTLRTAFQKCFGVSPIEYLRVRRLNQARQLLESSASGESTVTQIAFQLGFWDLGRFAKAYHQLFGQLPSDALRRSTRA